MAVYNSAWASREVLRAIDDETAVREDARGMVLFSTLSVVGSIALPRLLQSVRRIENSLFLKMKGFENTV